MADDWDDNNTYTDLPLNYEELEEMENEWIELTYRLESISD